MDGLWIGLGIVVAMLAAGWWIGRPKGPGLLGGKARSEAEIEALQRAAGLYMGPLPEDERRAFEKASNIVRARVLSTMQTGETINLNVVLDISLKVEAAEGPYDVTIKEPIAYKDLYRFAEGNEIDVYANPNDRTKVLLCDPELAAIMREEA